MNFDRNNCHFFNENTILPILQLSEIYFMSVISEIVHLAAINVKTESVCFEFDSYLEKF